MKRICIDQDQVLASLNSEWMRRYNYDYNDVLTEEDLIYWDWTKVVKPECGKKIYDYLDDPELFLNLPVIEGSQEATLKLSEKYELFVITSPFRTSNVTPKDLWLLKNFPHIHPDNFVYTKNKSISNAEYLIDDKPANLISYRGEGLLFTASHNLDEYMFNRVNGWDDVLDYFEWIEGGYQ